MGRNAKQKRDTQTLVIAGHEVEISSSSKILFPKTKQTKLDLVQYYVTVAD